MIESPLNADRSPEKRPRRVFVYSYARRIIVKGWREAAGRKRSISFGTIVVCDSREIA
jgi:hypothetical protein